MSAQSAMEAEEQVVAELGRLGVSYLSRQTVDSDRFPYAPDELLRQLVCQPSSRVRVALISLLLARPDYAGHALKALDGLSPEGAQRLRIFYTAAVILQQKYADQLQTTQPGHWRKLPDLFSDDLGIAKGPVERRLQELARLHAQWSGNNINWAGTYENAARLLVRQWELERK